MARKRTTTQLPGALATGDMGGLVKIDPSTTGLQARLVPDATPANSGVMTKAQARQLANMANQILIPPSDPVRFEIFVRDSPVGNDTTGNGTEAKPYASIGKALSTIPLIKIGPRYVINCDGHTETDPNIVFPPFMSSMPLVDVSLTGRHPAFTSEGYVTIQALPTTLLTLNAATTTYSQDPITQLLIVEDSSAAWAPDEWKGKIIAGAGFFEFARVRGNDATHLFTTTFVNALTAPVVLQQPSCVLNNTVPFSPTVSVKGVRAKILFQGIAIAGDHGLRGDSFDYIETDICDLGGPFLLSGDTYFDEGSYILGAGGGTITDSVFVAAVIGWLFTLIEGLTPNVTCENWSGTSGSVIGSRFVDGAGFVEFADWEFIGGAGLVVGAGFTAALLGVRVDDAVATAHVNPNGSAIVIQGGATVEFLEGAIGGSGSAGYGVECVQQGCGTLAQNESVTFTIAGVLGELKVGANAARTWVDFNTNPPVLSETDAVNHLARVGVNF